MKNKKPNVLVFLTKKKNQYIYDACTNRVFPAPPPYPEMLEDYNFLDKQTIVSKFRQKFDIALCTEAYNQIDKWVNIDNAFFDYEAELKEFSYSEEDYWDSVFSYYVPQLILGVTDECNFRCKYCVYGGTYENRRTHSTNYMDFKTAKKAIDYFLGFLTIKENTTFVHKSKAISFYGGEPLLNFALIKEVIKYVKDRYDYHNIDFRITTNGALLTDDVINFLVNNNISLAISMDGPKEEHDRNRVFKGGGKTFDTVYKNISKIREKYRDYFNDKLQIQACYDMKTDLFKVNDFFLEQDKKLPNYHNLTAINTTDTKYYDGFDKKARVTFSRNLKNLRKSYFEHLSSSEKRRKNIADSIFRKNSTNVVCRTHYKVSSYTGCCTPGTRVFVTIDGKYHICERINESFPVGDCDTGLDFDKIYEIKKDYYNEVIKKNNCNTCHVRHTCPVCFVFFAKEGKFESGNRCESIKANFKKDLIEFYSIYECNSKVIEKFYPEPSFVELQ